RAAAPAGADGRIRRDQPRGAETLRMRPPLRIRLIGRTLSWLVARVPWLWPLLRGPTRRFWNCFAAQWSSRPATPGRLAPLEEALERVGRRACILEVGTGSGEGAVAIAGRFPHADLTVVDLSPNMLATARGKLADQVRLEVADAADLPFADGTFDLVAQ